ncbi:peptide deformylase [Candidatus Woesebacteria bacterium]|nr:peptide deformylase [Candidatus Woesebacteria bacterium]
MVRKVLSTQDPRLRQKSKSVGKIDKKILSLIDDLKDTLKSQNDPEGVGLAAPQIGVFLRVFVMRYEGKITPVINPEVIELSKETNDPAKGRKKKIKKQKEYAMEGCLSLPHYYGPVQRSRDVKLKYQNTKMGTVTKSLSGFPAQIVQHEIDHLNGRIFVDRLFEQKRQLFQLKKGEWHEVELP